MNKVLVLLCAVFFLTNNNLINAQILTSSKHPIIIINTDDEDIPDEPKIDGTMGIIYNGEGEINTINDPFNHYDGNIGIETRGNSTQGFEKKTYSVELRDQNNNDLSVNLFGMGGEEDWILHAMVIDKSQLRIPMSFYFFQQMGHYASEWKYVELILNGEYRGLYILVEKIKRDDDRVDIAKLDSDDLAGDSLTGGYILRIDWTYDIDMEEDGFESAYESQAGIPMYFQWYYPRADRIEEEQAQYIQEWINTFENALFSSDYTNNEGKRYDEYIDLNSFADFLLINELSKNSDGYKLSSYLHKQRDSDGGKLAAGPIWDFDQTYGVSRVCSNDDHTGWTYLQNQNECEDLESMPMWWQRLMSDDQFKNHVKCRWETLREGVFHKDSINTWIDTQVDFIAEAIDRNFTVWDYFIGNSIWIEPFPIPQTYGEEVDVLKSWMSDRIDWMDSNMPGDCSLVGTSTEKVKSTIDVYPNPVSDKLTVEADAFRSLELIQMDGKVIRRSSVNQMDLSAERAGVYFLRIQTANEVVLRKIVKL